MFEDAIRRHLIDNDHKLRLISTPDERRAGKAARDEAAKLEQLQSILDDSEKRAIVADSAALQKYQTALQD